MTLKLLEEYVLLKWTYLSKACDKVSSDVITTSLQLKLSNGADAKSCEFEVNQTTTFGGYYRLSLGGRLHRGR